MYTCLKRFASLLLMLGLSPAAPALELFGVNLETTNRDELRNAVRDAGVVLIREGGEANWFDAYDSATVLVGSSRLYLGFVKQDQRFAFAEYEFNGLNPQPILNSLTVKYGPAETRAGRFLSDRNYRWQRDGIEIELSSDWQNYKIRLSYINPANMADLLAEQSADDPTAAATEAVSLY
jgi:hypothetical protein